MQENVAIASLRPQLEEPFPDNVVRYRPGNHGEELAYVPAACYINKLNQVFGAAWDFKVLRHEVVGDEYLVLVELTAAGVVKQDVGGAAVQRNRETGEPISLADSFKSACSDGLKRAARLYGIGLGLYGGDLHGNHAENGGSTAAPASGKGRAPEKDAAKPGGGNGKAAQGNGASANDNGNGGNGDGGARLSSRQMAAIFAIAHDKGLDRSKIAAKVHERFGKNLEFLSKSEASWFIEELTAA